MTPRAQRVSAPSSRLRGRRLSSAAPPAGTHPALHCTTLPPFRARRPTQALNRHGSIVVVIGEAMNAPSLVPRGLDLLAPAPAGRFASDVEPAAGDECAAALRVTQLQRHRATLQLHIRL